jgi:hypothetical protein
MLRSRNKTPWDGLLSHYFEKNITTAVTVAIYQLRKIYGLRAPFTLTQQIEEKKVERQGHSERSPSSLGRSQTNSFKESRYSEAFARVPVQDATRKVPLLSTCVSSRGADAERVINRVSRGFSCPNPERVLRISYL